MNEQRAADIPRHIRIQGAILRVIGLAIIRLAYRVKVVNADRLPAKGGALLLPNHVTFADAFFISAACPRPVRFVMDDTVLRFAAVRWFCAIFNTVNIRKGQSREALRLTVDAVNHGDIVCYFAEGQLSRTGALNELKRGVELIAGKISAPLVPLWIDGAWGSVFSFERNVFFKKKPYRLPHDQFVAFGEPLEPDRAATEAIRDSLLRASADALRLRFAQGATAVEINGYQIGQVNALPWRRPFAALAGDPIVTSLPVISDGFSQTFGSLVEWRDTIGRTVRSWVGGDALREKILGTRIGEPIDFYDFGSRAMEPLEHGNVCHFPCLAIGGRVVSMSMPHPARPHPGSAAQTGNKPGTWGKLLPGWYIENGRVKGPATEGQGLPLPAGTFLDEEGFIAIKGR